MTACCEALRRRCIAILRQRAEADYEEAREVGHSNSAPNIAAGDALTYAADEIAMLAEEEPTETR